MQAKSKGQIERLSKVLMDLKSSISAKDRELAFKKFKHTEQTLSVYLNGKGTSIDTAFSLIEFFKGCIAERDRKAGIEVPSEPDKQLVA